MDDLIITDMTPDDFELIKNTLIEDFGEVGTEADPTYKNIAAKDKLGKIVGFAGIWNGIYDFHITHIAVRKDLRNQGIGSALLKNLIELARQNKMESITLEVMCTNTAAIKLYEKFGFKNAGFRKNYYQGKYNAYIMTLNLH